MTNSAHFARISGELADSRAHREAEKLRAARTMSDFRLLHDLEQAAYLVARGAQVNGLVEAHDALATANARQARTGAETAISLTEAEAEAVAAFRARVVRQPLAAVWGSALDEAKDWVAVEDSYFGTSPNIVVIDDFLSRDAWTQLRDFALLSTVWRREYERKYLGAFPDAGFVGPLHFQIAEELKQKMPRIFGPHRLRQVWGFKYSSTLNGRGIGVHADFARVNLNFWLTPDDANLDPQSGSMVIYDAPAPKSWSYRDYNGNYERTYAFLQEQRATAMTVPHRCNRAVLFNSALFHETDGIHFKEGYENRRINVTYLFA